MAKKVEKGLQREILDTARHLLTTTGYTRLSMRNIASKIGYSATSIYLHFENKDELVHALIDEGVEKLHDELREASNSQDPPDKRLRAMCEAYVAFGIGRSEYYEIMYVLHPEYIKRYPAEKYRKARRILELIGLTIREGISCGQFVETDTVLAANLAWTQLHGVVTLISSDRVDRRIAPELLIASACDHIVHSLSSRKEFVTKER